VYIDSQGHYFSERIHKELKKDIVIIIFDKTKQSLETIRNGYANAIIAQRQGVWGEIIVRRLYDVMHGKTLTDIEDTGTYEINKRNLSIFLDNK
jgi:methyl-accepting chemotaxis protein